MLNYISDLGMEIQRPKTSLQQKLALLKALQQGDIEQSQNLLKKLSHTARTNPDLYIKFHDFVAERRLEIEKIQRQSQSNQQQIIIVDGYSQHDDWETDQKISYESQQGQKQQIRQPSPKQLVKNLGHSKSSILIKTVKEPIKPYFIHTLQPQKPIHSSTVNLKNRQQFGNKTIQNHSLVTNLTKSTNLALKAKSKPYFPPINGAKNVLKLSKK